MKDKHCKECGLCDGTLCNTLFGELNLNYELPDKFPQSYNGLRFTSDAMDCSLPIAIDQHSGCAYNCTYCFSNSLQRAPDRNPAVLQRLIKHGSFFNEWNIKKLEKFLNRELKDDIAKAMYPLLDQGCPVQFGALGDPFDDLELHSGWAKKAIPLFIKYKIPVRVGTKAGINLQRPGYLKLFEDSPEQFWFAFSIISNSDDLIKKIDIRAPVTSERLKAMKLLTNLGCKASLRFRPFLPGISDAYPGEPNAWEVLMDRCNEAGARAVSFEYIFLNPAPTERQAAMYRLMFKTMGRPNFDKEWGKDSQRGVWKQNEAGLIYASDTGSVSCRRASRKAKYDITMKVKDKALSLGWNFGCSDPHFKEENSSGGCCGFSEQDKWFGNWSRRQLTEVIVQAKRAYEAGKPRQFTYNDWRPEWAHKVRVAHCISLGDWHTHRKLKTQTFGDIMRKKWNTPNHPRSPYMYFGGMLRPVGIDNNSGDLVYEYRPWDEEYDEKFKGE